MADICIVSNTFVGEVRKELEAQRALEEERNKPADDSNQEPPPRPKRRGTDGKEYSVPARPKSSAPPRPEPKPHGTLDATGIAVPEEIVPYWDSTFTEAQELWT